MTWMRLLAFLYLTLEQNFCILVYLCIQIILSRGKEFFSLIGPGTVNLASHNLGSRNLEKEFTVDIWKLSKKGKFCRTLEYFQSWIWFIMGLNFEHICFQVHHKHTKNTLMWVPHCHKRPTGAGIMRPAGAGIEWHLWCFVRKILKKQFLILEFH